MIDDFPAYAAEIQNQHERAQERAQRAGRRAAQLKQWSVELAGRRSAIASAAAEIRARDAFARTEEAIQAADQAKIEARAGYRRAAWAVRRAARMHEWAAELGVGDVQQHRRRAAQLYAEAAEDERHG
ncbi:hypothetical protein [Planobispora takensis]|nr:hypothetical protein [Planobispora takensis]